MAPRVPNDRGPCTTGRARFRRPSFPDLEHAPGDDRLRIPDCARGVSRGQQGCPNADSRWVNPAADCAAHVPGRRIATLARRAPHRQTTRTGLQVEPRRRAAWTSLRRRRRACAWISSSGSDSRSRASRASRGSRLGPRGGPRYYIIHSKFLIEI